MRAVIPVSLLCLALAGGMVAQSGVRTATPVQTQARPITRIDAELLVLVTRPVLQDFSHGAPVVGASSGRLEAMPGRPGEMYWIRVSSPSGVQLGMYRVDARTAQVFDAKTGREIHNPELEAAQWILRESHGIAMVAPATLHD